MRYTAIYASAISAVAVLSGAVGVFASDDHLIFTLYRDSPLGQDVRVHVATFDAAEGADYNLRNCMNVGALLNQQQEQLFYGCEAGEFRASKEIVNGGS